MRVLLYDEGKIKRALHNQKLINGLSIEGLELVACNRGHEFPNEPSVESLLLGDQIFDFYLLVQLSENYDYAMTVVQLAKEERGIKNFNDVVVIGSGGNHDGAKLIKAPDGYLQQHHLPQLREILKL